MVMLFIGLTRERRKPCSATPPPSTNHHQILTGFRNVFRNFSDQCTKTGKLHLPSLTGYLSQFVVADITPSSTTSTCWRPTWSRRTGRRRSQSSTWLILTGGECWKLLTATITTNKWQKIATNSFTAFDHKVMSRPGLSTNNCNNSQNLFFNSSLTLIKSMA